MVEIGGIESFEQPREKHVAIGPALSSFGKHVDPLLSWVEESQREEETG